MHLKYLVFLLGFMAFCGPLSSSAQVFCCPIKNKCKRNEKCSTASKCYIKTCNSACKANFYELEKWWK